MMNPGGHGERHRYRVELRCTDAVPHRLSEAARYREPVIEECEMKFACFERSADIFIIFARRPVPLRKRVAP
jgi:hypothetical protein